MILEINISKCQHESIPSLLSFGKNDFQIVKIILVAAERIFILSRCFFFEGIQEKLVSIVKQQTSSFIRNQSHAQLWGLAMQIEGQIDTLLILMAATFVVETTTTSNAQILKHLHTFRLELSYYTTRKKQKTLFKTLKIYIKNFKINI